MKLNPEPRTLPEARTVILGAQAELDRQEGEITTLKQQAAAGGPGDLTALKNENLQLKTEATTKDTEISGLKSKLTTAETQLSEKTTELTTVTNRATKAESEVSSLNSLLDGAAQCKTDEDKKLAAEEKMKRAGQNFAIDLCASHGLAPLQLGLSNKGSDPKDDTKPLTGRDRTAAAFRAAQGTN